MNNPTILDIVLGFILHKHSRDEYGRVNNKAQAIRELSNDEMATLLNELIAQENNCPRSIDGWKEWLNEEVK